MARWLLGSMLVLAVGCGSGVRDGDDDGGANPDGGADTDGDAGGGTDTTADGCSEAAQKIYAVDEDRTFYRFDPPTKKLDLVGTIACGDSTVFSMAVTRDAVAYVLMLDGVIWEVSTADASCTATPYQTGQQGFTTFGMGFATDGPDVTTEKLFVADPSKLAWIDDAWKLSLVGPITGNPELTGNGLGELWGFFPQAATVHISHIDKAAASEIDTFNLPSLSNGASAWAFAYWGGAFYVFYQADADPSTSVYRVRADDGQIETWMADTGRRIVGAGVSTCAPTTVQ
jgi:hypothetical protein